MIVTVILDTLEKHHMPYRFARWECACGVTAYQHKDKTEHIASAIEIAITQYGNLDVEEEDGKSKYVQEGSPSS